MADLIEENKTELATLESLDNGKPLQCSLDEDIPGVVSVFRYYAGLCDKYSGKTLPIGKVYFKRYSVVSIFFKFQMAISSV